MRHYKKCVKYIICIILLAAVNAMMFAGCGGTQGQGASDTGNINGSILVVGSTALQPLVEQAANQFLNENPDASIQVQGGGSGQGLTTVSNGAAQIGNSDIYAEEKSGIDVKSLEDHKVCVAGFAVIVNPGVNVDNLTSGQLVDIFTGKINNWSSIGGGNGSIVIINRPASSGTRATFKKYALNGANEVSGKALTQDSSGAVLQAVAGTPGAISYIGLSYIMNNTSVRVVKIDGVEPNAENIINGSYKIWSYEHMYTKGPAQGLTKAFIDFILSNEIKPLIKHLGYIPVDDMKVTR